MDGTDTIGLAALPAAYFSIAFYCIEIRRLQFPITLTESQSRQEPCPKSRVSDRQGRCVRPDRLKRRQTMNWDTVKGDWKQFSGKVKEQWGKLTNDELAQINGNREQLEGKIQAKYGYAKDKAKQEVDDWCNRM